MLMYIIFMLIAILIGLYLGWWSLVRERENTPPGSPHSLISHYHAVVI
jgi:hypothetical protein